MKKFLLAIFLLALFVTACGGVPQSVQNRPIESYLDPNTKPEDKESLLQVLALVTPEARDDITFLTAKGSIYSTSEQARKAGALLKPTGEDVFELPDGSFRAFPTSGESPNNRNLTATGEPFGELDDCYRKGIGEKSGPIRRITHAQGTKKAPTNWMKVTIYLPKASEAGGFKQRIPNGKTMIPVYNAPFIYAGGWGNKGSGQSYVDAGFQMSTGNDANDAKNQWSLFVKASGVAYQDELYSQLGQVSDTYRFTGGSTVDLTFFNLSDLLIATAKEQGSNRSRVIALRLANDSRWSGNGVGNWYKMMTTIGQGRVRPNAPLQKLDSVGFLKNAAIKNMEIGYIDWGVLDKILRREIPEGEANVFERDNVTIEPRVGNGSNDQRKKFMQQGEYTDCKFPDDRAANDFRFDVTGNTNLIYDKVVQVVKTSDGELTSIDLRTPTSLQVSENKLPVSKPAWIPALPNQADQPLPSATPDITVKLKGKPKALGSTVKTLFFQNYGSLNSLLEFRAYPIGQVDTDTNLQKALDRKGQTGIVLWGNKSTNANELEDIASLSQLATKPPKSPWADGLYAARSTVNLRRPNNIRMTRGIDQTKLEIEATCPEKPESTPYKARFPIIYSTGLADDGVTPETPANQKFSTVDDEPQKRVMWVNLELECIVPAKIAINPTPITLTGNVGSSTNTENLIISNTGDLDSTLEYKQYFVSDNILDTSLLNPINPLAGAALRPLAVVVPPTLENSLIRASGFSPSSTSEDELTVTKNPNLPDELIYPEDTIPVSYYCSSAGSFTRYVNVVYKTGATNDAGVEILENAVVSIMVECKSEVKLRLLTKSQEFKGLVFKSYTFSPKVRGQTGITPIRDSGVLVYKLSNDSNFPVSTKILDPDDPRVTMLQSDLLTVGSNSVTTFSIKAECLESERYGAYKDSVRVPILVNNQEVESAYIDLNCGYRLDHVAVTKTLVSFYNHCEELIVAYLGYGLNSFSYPYSSKLCSNNGLAPIITTLLHYLSLHRAEGFNNFRLDFGDEYAKYHINRHWSQNHIVEIVKDFYYESIETNFDNCYKGEGGHTEFIECEDWYNLRYVIDLYKP